MSKTSAHVVLLRNNNREVLLTERADMPLWVIPGGQQEENEKIEDTAAREICEETGLSIKIKSLKGIYTSPRQDFKNYTFLGEIVSGEPKLSDETNAVAWWNIDCLPFNMLRFDKKRIRDMLNREKHITQKNYYINYTDELKIFSKKPMFLIKLLYLYIKANT